MWVINNCESGETRVSGTIIIDRAYQYRSLSMETLV